MEHCDVPGVPNFSWAWGRALARGGQPPELEHFQALTAAGIGTVLSFRVDGESYEGAQCAYNVEEQRRWCDQAGLKFRHIPCPDRVAISPWAVAEALEAIDAEVDAGRAVFIHCIAGIGRTGVITSAWLMSRGLDADAAAARFLQSFDAWCVAHAVSREDRMHHFASVGAAERWWTLHQIATALGCPITQSFDLQVPSCPDTAHDWERAYEGCLQHWRERRLIAAQAP